MTEDGSKRRISISEICRVEGHASVYVDVVGDRVESVKMDVFEGMRFFERLVVGQNMRQMPHITSRVCAICSTGHVLAANRAVEAILGYSARGAVALFRELMHLGMIIESHSTHIYALALPDFLGFGDVHAFATEHADAFSNWTRLRKLGSAIQSTVGGRPFHPVNLQVGGLSSFPAPAKLLELKTGLADCEQLAFDTCEQLSGFAPPVARTSIPAFLALIPDGDCYGYMGDIVKFSTGEEHSIAEYGTYLKEESVPHSHAKRSSVNGEPLMVGSMARLFLFYEKLSASARSIFDSTALSKGDTNSIWNNLAQAIEVVEAIDRSKTIIDELLASCDEWSGVDPTHPPSQTLEPRSGSGVGAVECPRGTLYHYYELDDKGTVLAADMITPSAQNTYRIERDIQEVVSQVVESLDQGEIEARLRANLETLVRAYDPCNTCATHMVSLKFARD